MNLWKTSGDLIRHPYRDVAQTLLSRVDCWSPPVDIEAVARMLGITDIRHQALGAISGSLIAGKSTTIVLLNSEHSEQRQRFTLAHEVAHQYFGDAHTEGTVQWRGAAQGRDPREQRCDAMASELLMPWHLIQDYINEHLSILLIARFAGAFNVSIESAALRLGAFANEDIQIIAWEKNGPNLVQKWTCGPARLVAKGQRLPLSDRASTSVQATFLSGTVIGFDTIYTSKVTSQCQAEARTFGKIVLSILRRSPRRTAARSKERA